MPTGKKIRLRCYADPEDATLVFDRLFGISQSAHLFLGNALVFRAQAMTLHYEGKLRISV